MISQVEHNVHSTHPDVIKQDAVVLAKLRTGLGGTKVDVSGVGLANLIQSVKQPTQLSLDPHRGSDSQL